MPINYNNYRVRPAGSWGPGVTQRKHIAEIFAKQPVQLNEWMVRAFTANYGYLFSTFLKEHTSVREFESDEEYTWKLIGSTYKNIPLIEARKDDGSPVAPTDTNVGQGGSLIQLVFPEPYFAESEVIVGELNEFYQFRIVEEPIMEGPNAVYYVELMAGGQEGVPGDRLQPGEKFSWEFAPVESELSRKAGGIRKAVPTTMRNEWTTIRKYHKVTGAADQQLKLDISITIKDKDAKGKEVQRTIDSWFDNESWIFNQEWEKEKERARFYSRSNRNSNGSYLNYGKSGNVIKEGDGLFAQMLYGNTHQYNGFNENFDIHGLANAIYEICEQGNVPLSDRTFIILTGSRGMIQVNEAIKKDTAGFTMGPSATGNTNGALTYNGDALGIVSRVDSNVHQTALAYGAQFVEWRGANNIVLKFVYEPALDDRERNKRLGPNGKGVLSSYAYYCFDLGSKANPNMYLCKIRGQEDTFKYRIGMRNPWGISNNNVINYDEDSAEIHVMTTLGACILDPTRCLTYLPAGLIA
jgi:hypothetical protein